MSRDHIIRSKLYKNGKLHGAVIDLCGLMSREPGAVNMLVDALTYPALRLVIMRALAVMTSHGGMSERISVADKSMSKIILMALATPADQPLFESCITVICHTCKP